MTLEDGGEKLVRRLAALSERQQRVAILAEEAERLGMAAFADLLAVVIDRSIKSRGERDLLALSATMDYLDSETFSHEHRLALLSASHEAGHGHLVRLLSSPGEHRAGEVERVPDYGTGRPLTLGERKSLARKPSRQIIERVMVDPHPGVIQNLLRNPKLTETDVVRIASRRPNYAKVLREIFKSARWGKQYSVKLAIAGNPYTPPTLALKILPLLLRQDLKDLVEDQNLHLSVLVTCRRILEGESPVETGNEGDEEPTVH